MMKNPTAAESPISKTPGPESPASPTHEVLPEAPKRRVFSPAEKLRIVKAAWRKAFEANGVVGLSARKPGRKSGIEPKDAQIAALSARAQRL